MAKRKQPKNSGVATGSTSTDKSLDSSPRVPQRDKIGFSLSIQERQDWTDKQKKLIDLIMSKDAKLILIDGPAGTSKTFTAVYCALQLLAKRSMSDLLYVRSIIESASKSIGSLPGTSEEKLDPFLMPLYDKLDELLPRGEVDKLIKDERVSGVPINFLRGANFNARFVLGDEMQNMTMGEIVTLITRLGQFSKMVLVGDKDQSDLNGKSGWTKIFDMFNDEESRAQGIHCFSFTKDDVVRSGIVRYIVGRIENHKIASVKSEPMFPAR